MFAFTAVEIGASMRLIALIFPDMKAKGRYEHVDSPTNADDWAEQVV